MTRTIRLLLAAPALALALVQSAAADSVTLRPSARVAPGEPVRIGDIADLEGPDAERLAEVEVARADSGAFEIALDSVRQRAVAAGADPSRIAFRGERTVVRPLRAAKPRPDAEPKATAAPAAPKTVVIDPAATADAATPIAIACGLVSNAQSEHRGSLRIEIAADELARIAPEPGFRYEVAPKSALSAERVDVEIAALRGDEVVKRERVRLHVRVEREVAVAKAAAKRGERLAEETIAVERRLVSVADAGRVADPTAARDATLARTVSAGEVLRSDDLARQIAVRRNERVIVRREIGMVAIELEAIALEDGAPGETIALERRGAVKARDGRPISAEVVGRGRAVIR
ncbi:MAG: flagellar basal body P-ring formation chaperone FlgA [Planctomycetota bacterium]